MSAVDEMHKLERLWHESPHSDEFLRLQRSSKWGERIREEVIRGIERNEQQAIEDGILYLEVDPWYFRSGYHKGIIARKLKAPRLSEDQQARLRGVILKATASSGPEFREYARLAITVADDSFLREVAARTKTAASWVRRRLALILELHRKHSVASTRSST